MKTYFFQHTFGEKAVFFGSHYKVVRFVLVVHDVFEIDARARVEIAEELLVENERHAADFFNAGLRLRELVDEVYRYRDGQLPTELFPLEPCDISGQMHTLSAIYVAAIQLCYVTKPSFV
jgi:hypothetical protein